MIKRVNRGKSHSYVDDETGVKVPGVTSILDGGIPKPALINWAANATAEAAIDRWDELAALTPSVRLKTLQGARYAAKDIAANRGTQVHELAEKLVAGQRVTVPEGLEGHVEAYVRFLDEWNVEPILVEKTVHSKQHGYCGTFDLIAYLDDPDDPDRRPIWLLDIKTNRSGIFGETALQLAGYRYADVWIDEDVPEEVEMPEVDCVGAVHVRPDGYSLIPVEASPLQHRQLLYAQQIARWAEASRDLIGQPLDPPTTSGYVLTREEL